LVVEVESEGGGGVGGGARTEVRPICLYAPVSYRQDRVHFDGHFDWNPQGGFKVSWKRNNIGEGLADPVIERGARRGVARTQVRNHAFERICFMQTAWSGSD
jgi:hypothetical protein